MTRNTALSLAILAAIGLYFLAQVRPGDAPRPSASEVRVGETPSGTQTAASEERGAPQVVPHLCRARITWLTRGGEEVRFAYEGEAEAFRARWPSGQYLARINDVCTGTECRLVLPRPALSEVQIALDACPWVEVP
ncbi:hypothetical protein KZX47_11735 [Thermus sp. SYSU G05001]|uniref:Uncharacterized protein n=1 Tax=Thermus brevis TaxID=2862456 RepID=A0ABS7A0J9_9DEIN|nr:hypothetical protein [Thermus brevis]